MMNIVVPIFIHEYAHLEQNIRNKSGKDSDFGYITVGITNDMKRGGKRGGFHRSTKTTPEYLRYKGSVDEIDSFASDAAAELVQAIHVRDYYGDGGSPDDINSAITALKQDMTQGYTSSSTTYNHYEDLLRAAFDGHYAKTGLKPEQMEKVWKRFVKKVFQKLDDYRFDTSGKLSARQTREADDEFLSYAKRNKFSDTVKHLADMTGLEMMANENVSSKADLDYFRERLGRNNYWTSDPVMRKAEKFLSDYYVGDPWENEELDRKIRDIFRKFVRRYIDNYRIA
jgi:hypothetical protein